MGAQKEAVPPEKAKPLVQQETQGTGQSHVVTPAKKPKEQSVAKMVAKKVGEAAAEAAKTALILLLSPVALASGCSPDAIGASQRWPADSGKNKYEDAGAIVPDAGKQDAGVAKDAGLTEKLEWWPGYMYNPETDAIVDVSLGFKPGYFCESSPCYGSEDAIPQSLRDDGHSVIQTTVDFSRFFIKDAAFDAVAANNIFVIQPSLDVAGTYGGGQVGFVIRSESGQDIANCFDGCYEYERVKLKKGSERVIFHEMLHDVWFTYLTDSQKEQHATNARLFFNALGKDTQTDERIGAIWRGAHHDPDNPGNMVELPFQHHLEGSELGDWAAGALAGMSESEASDVKEAIRAYLEIHSAIAFPRTVGMTEENRDHFIVSEGFAYMGADYPVLDELYDQSQSDGTRYIPSFMRNGYSAFMNGTQLDGMLNDGSGNFSTTSAFNAFVPYLQSFVEWMTAKYPEIP